MKPYVRVLIAIIVLVAMIAPRIASLTAFTAADEPFWLVVSANYYYALTHREFQNTVYEYHPAVTTMWIGTAAMLAYFPEYRGLMNGYFQQEKTSFDTYLLEHGKDPLGLLWWSRLFQTLTNVLLWLIAYVLIRYLLGEWPALAALLLASFAPYLFGQSRMLNHESMVGLFTLDSLLALIAYLERGRRPLLLVLSALFAALANLTKSSSIILIAVVAGILLAHATANSNDSSRRWPGVLRALKWFGSWLVLLVVFYVLIWPGMWVAPGKMMHEVFGNAFSYAFQGARLSVTQNLEPSSFSLDAAGAGIGGFLRSIAWRTTPLTWLGLLLAAILGSLRGEAALPRTGRWVIAALLLEAAAVVVMFGAIQGRNSPHYVLAAHVCLETIAALGWAYALVNLGTRWPRWSRALPLLLVILLSLQAAGLAGTGPYYYTYYNPLLRAATHNNFPVFFYGEQMEAAAGYLAAKPNAAELTALVYFGRSFSYYFPGETIVVKPVFFEDTNQLLDNLRNSDYLVMYTGLHERLPILDDMRPEKLLYLHDREYVEIYRLADQPAELLQ